MRINGPEERPIFRAKAAAACVFTCTATKLKDGGFATARARPPFSIFNAPQAAPAFRGSVAAHAPISLISEICGVAQRFAPIGIRSDRIVLD